MTSTPTDNIQVYPADTLDGNAIRILNWNIQKLRSREWREDLSHLAKGVDLALIQEAALEPPFLESLKHVQCCSFTEGYTRGRIQTGVMTFSRVAPQSEQQFCAREPILRTPKAANLTHYAIENYHDTLLVVNMHAVNFCLGTQTYEQQLKSIADAIDNHRGPIIFAGDFNTWHPGRERILKDMALEHGLEEVIYEIDNRKKVFGRHLDYIFTRGLETIDAHSHHVRTSDHNPMLATFSL